MGKVNYSQLRHAVYFMGSGAQAREMYEWMIQYCQSPVFSDIYLQPIDEYMAETFSDMKARSAEEVLHYLFFCSSTDALMFKLAWGGRPFTPEDWLWVSDMDKLPVDRYGTRDFMAREMPDGSILVDSRVMHVR